MDTAVTWIVIALFYLPLHYLPPVLIVIIRSSEQGRRRAVRHTLLDCSLSMTASFVLAAWLVPRQQLSPAMAVLLVSMALPYIRILADRAREDRHG